MKIAGPHDEEVEALLGLVEEHRRDDFVASVEAMATTSGFEVATELLAAVQREVGRRWQDRRWTVADEHAATAAVDQALSAIARLGAGPAGRTGRIFVVCAEDEWHVLPARMFAERMRRVGCDAVFLGGSIPHDHLGTYLETHSPSVVALSTSISMHLPGARQIIDICHTAGIPVVAGGSAFGSDDRRARAIGADGWADSIETAVALFDSVVGAPLADADVDPTAQQALARQRSTIVESAMDLLARRLPIVDRFDDAQLRRTREDFDYIVRFVEATLTTADQTIVDDFLDWLGDVLAAVGLPETVLPLSLDVLRDVVPDDHVEALEAIALGRAHLH